MPVVDISELASRLPRGRRLLGLDLGSRTIGLAISDGMLAVASPLETIQRGKFTRDAERLCEIMRTREVGGLVVGLPLNMNGSEGPRCQSTRAFVANFLARMDMPVAFWDERLSTAAVERVLIDEADLSRKRRDRAVDKMAAAYILQGALDRIGLEDLPAAGCASTVPASMDTIEPALTFPHRHLLGIENLTPAEIGMLLDLSDSYAEANRRPQKKMTTLSGRTCINLFFETSTRTRTSFELAAMRLGADTINISVATSAIKKGETLIDTAMTLNAMHPDVLVVRHPDAGAVKLLSEKANCAVINAGDGSHEHPTQALLDAVTIRRHKGKLQGLLVALCGDITHSRVARSNILLLQTMGARVRVVAPPTLLPAAIERLGVEVFHDMRAGLADCDIVMMLRLQRERMHGTYVPSVREYFHFYGLDRKKLDCAKPDALIMHPGPMNRGVEIDSSLADDIDRSVIQEQVEMGVAVRMACLDLLTRNRDEGRNR